MDIVDILTCQSFCDLPHICETYYTNMQLILKDVILNMIHMLFSLFNKSKSEGYINRIEKRNSTIIVILGVGIWKNIQNK